MSKLKINDEQFKKAMSHFASGVTIVTTVDSLGAKWGFTASAFSSLSLNPPMALVCLSKSADCFQVFNQATGFAVNIITPKHEQLAFLFAKKGVDKFKGGEFIDSQDGLPILPDALVSIECILNKIYDGGDHVIITGIVNRANIEPCNPSIWYCNKFYSLDSNVCAS